MLCARECKINCVAEPYAINLHSLPYTLKKTN